ncbi:MAG TPA: PilN domain-containing protein [Hyphomicrobiaceae bacterium]|jgi:general secretion pathway protein L|nr:PilN domain-containing protein [Hyphomicrobiaceae bacterium]
MASGAPARQSLTDAAAGFFEWWRDELLGLVPQWLHRLLADAEAGVVLAQVDGGFQILAASSSRGRTEEAGPVLSRAQALAALADMAASRKAASVGVRLPFSLCFERRVELPKAARDDLRRMLSFDLERATPFRLGEVYTAALPAGEAGAKGKQRLRQLVVKREAVDPLIADVKAAGLTPAFVDCWQATPASGLPVNFLEASDPPRSGLARQVTGPRVLAVLVVLLAALAGVLSLSRYEAALAEIRAETAKLRTQAAAVREAMERSGAAVADLARLQQMKLGQVPTVEVLEELSRVLPDSVWLTDLRIEGDAVDIVGLAKSGAALPPLFVGSALFADAALTAPVTLDQREDKERFSLRIRIKPPAGAPPPAPTSAHTPKDRS